ncbi:DUF2076 domain-containing protein [Pseudorhodoplanes sinuspersici]|uniref:Uncharacterized protein n=1 Tax=Pseudorhodoplanes sinuspersici TaxID=1235591 RepID=A0A1W6ZRD9_9HYPH|nr:DUF2076 domain-containing protein [Pseudorhodoplanes sinuspersici]ARP99931.1 hypothetical protein CAK95_13180 [Pseudorhodoplanes sinuspersici]RKE70952.1 hypothetical protein DFP91_3204 [Pseudorhodoplanes sinuspersici]
MTPQERRLVEDLFEKLATLETQPREPDAEQAIMAGLRKAPNATYALVQTVLLQDEALRNAADRIRELEAAQMEMEQPQQGGGFLDSMRDTIFGGGARPRSSVPPVGGSDRPMGLPPGYRSDNPAAGGYPGAGAPPQGGVPQQPAPQQGGGSFLGTAAAAAVGTIGGAMLMNSLGGMFGHGKQSGTASAADLGGSKDANPWGGSGDASSSDLAKQAGVDHVGQSGASDRAGFSDQSGQGQDQGYDQGYDPSDDGYDDADMDAGDDSDFDLGDSDFV